MNSGPLSTRRHLDSHFREPPHQAFEQPMRSDTKMPDRPPMRSGCARLATSALEVPGRARGDRKRNPLSKCRLVARVDAAAFPVDIGAASAPAAANLQVREAVQSPKSFVVHVRVGLIRMALVDDVESLAA